jgi:thymidine kinase
MAKLYFYYSAMNAGKSTMLLQSSYNYHERGMQTLVFTPSIDTRFAKDTVNSRIGLTAGAITFDSSFDFYVYVQERLKNGLANLRCILIDEAQFLNKQQVMQLSSIADHLHIPVLTYGLRSDFRGEPFEGSQYLLAWAEELVEIKTICHCGKKATMNMRIDENGNAVKSGKQIEIGGNERYISVCRVHFTSDCTATLERQR